MDDAQPASRGAAPPRAVSGTAAACGGPDTVPEEAVATALDPCVEEEPIAHWRYTPYLIAFLTAACMMVVEMLASRMIARQVGSSLYTWTSVIGVVLAGVSLGSFAGGRLADWFKAGKLLGWLFLLSSVTCLVTLFLNYYFWMNQPLKGWHWPPLVFTTVLCVFFLPSLLLGTFSPVCAKLALGHSTRVGFTLGSVAAWGAVGSIVGTVGAGFWLVSALGTKSLLLLVAWVLAGGGLLLGPWRLLHCWWLIVITLALIVSRDGFGQKTFFRLQPALQEAKGDYFAADSKYQYVRVYEKLSDRDPGRTLRVLALDFLIHGYVDPDDPSHLEYDYEKVYAEVARRYAQDKPTISALFLGGGSYTFPRWTLSEWPGAKIVVAEIDPVVIEANHRALGLPRNTPIRSIALDARIAVEGLPASEMFDFALGDAFNDLSSPFHLSTLEFDRKVKQHLKPDGAYLVNVIDSFETALLVGSIASTLRKVFRYVYVFCTEKGGVKKTRDTFVIAASDVPLDVSGWEPGHDTDFAGSVLTEEQMTELARKCRNRVLTDDDAPVENLIAPVLRMRKQP